MSDRLDHGVIVVVWQQGHDRALLAAGWTL